MAWVITIRSQIHHSGIGARRSFELSLSWLLRSRGIREECFILLPGSSLFTRGTVTSDLEILLAELGSSTFDRLGSSARGRAWELGEVFRLRTVRSALAFYAADHRGRVESRRDILGVAVLNGLVGRGCELAREGQLLLSESRKIRLAEDKTFSLLYMTD